MGYVVALDIGTTSTRAIAFDHGQRIAGVRQQEVSQYYPEPGWVEEDAMELWASSFGVLQELLALKGIHPDDVKAIGITNQRETTIVWERATGRPVYNAIVWQCRRTADLCEEIKGSDWEQKIFEKTGLVIDAYFSATKLAWILDRVDPDRSRAKAGELMFGTVDTWILWKLTEGRVHATDYTNASRTMLFNINTLDWDDELLAYFNIPRCMLPEVHPSGHVFGTASIGSAHIEVPVAGIAGDQRGALRADVLGAGRGEKYLRHRLFPADEYRQDADEERPWPGHDDRGWAGCAAGLCAGGLDLCGRRGDPVAAR